MRTIKLLQATYTHLFEYFAAKEGKAAPQYDD
jgi:hypothetical protein